MVEVGSWQHCSYSLHRQLTRKEEGAVKHCLEEADSIYVFLYETQRTNSKNNPQR